MSVPCPAGTIQVGITSVDHGIIEFGDTETITCPAGFTGTVVIQCQDETASLLTGACIGSTFIILIWYSNFATICVKIFLHSYVPACTMYRMLGQKCVLIILLLFWKCFNFAIVYDIDCGFI